MFGDGQVRVGVVPTVSDFRRGHLNPDPVSVKNQCLQPTICFSSTYFSSLNGIQGILDEGRGYRDAEDGSGEMTSEQLREGSVARLEVIIHESVQ